MGVISIACYRPKPGCDPALRKLLKEHLPTLRRVGLTTERPSILGRAPDGTYVEVFEWVSSSAIEQAHHHPVVQEMWSRFNSAADYIAPGAIKGWDNIFPGLEPVELD